MRREIKIPGKDGTCTLMGGRKYDLEYHKPDWSDEEEESFVYRGHRYYISEFLRVPDGSFLANEKMDGYSNDSYFSGIAIRLDPHGEFVQAYTFIC